MPKTTEKPAKYVLFTNIDYASIGPVRAHVSALLLEEYDDMFDREKRACRVRGFGTDPAWPVFDIFVKSIAYEATDGQSPHVFLGGDDKPRPLSTGLIVQLKDGPQIQITVNDRKHPIDIERFEGDILPVWSRLSWKAAKYWDAPNMPTLEWRNAGVVRAMRG